MVMIRFSRKELDEKGSHLQIYTSTHFRSNSTHFRSKSILFRSNFTLFRLNSTLLGKIIIIYHSKKIFLNQKLSLRSNSTLFFELFFQSKKRSFLSKYFEKFACLVTKTIGFLSLVQPYTIYIVRF